MLSFGVPFIYTSPESVNRSSEIDLVLGFGARLVGAGNPAGGGVCPVSASKLPQLHLVATDTSVGMGYIALVTAVSTRQSVWKQADGSVKSWLYIYEAMPVTEIMAIPYPQNGGPGAVVRRLMDSSLRDELCMKILRESQYRNDALIMSHIVLR